MAHVITITGSPADEDWPRDDYEYEITGDHDHQCETWWECLSVNHRHPKNDDEMQEEWATKRTPELHRWIDGTWMVRNRDTCGLRLAFEDGSPFDSAAERGGYAPVGVYDVTVDWDGDWWSANLSPAALTSIK